MTYAGQQKIGRNAHSESCGDTRRTTKRCFAGKQRTRPRQRKNNKHRITKKQMREKKRPLVKQKPSAEGHRKSLNTDGA